MVGKRKNRRDTFQFNLELMDAAKEASRISHISSKANLSTKTSRKLLEELIKFGMVEKRTDKNGKSSKKRPIQTFKTTYKGLGALEEANPTNVTVPIPPSSPLRHRK